MDPVVSEYLKRILNTISFTVLWMAINSTAGIMYQFAYLQEGASIQVENILFYLWLIVSFLALLYYLIRLWKKPLNFKE
ncbi:MAG: hypothetical protein D4R41_01595 [Sediminibacterium sp.]|jgi:hypothetical protein|nr:MAG: hypothetical protein D4R41_01595 [Sediminibacterium sp.]